MEPLWCLRVQFYTLPKIWSFNTVNQKSAVKTSLPTCTAATGFMVLPQRQCFTSRLVTHLLPPHTCISSWLVSCLNCNYNWPRVHWMWYRDWSSEHPTSDTFLGRGQLHNDFLISTWAFRILKIQIPSPHREIPTLQFQTYAQESTFYFFVFS